MADTVVGAFSRVTFVTWTTVLSLSVLNYGLRFVRWQGYLVRLGHRVPSGPSLLCYLGGFALTATPGKAGEMVRSVLLQRWGVGFVESLACLVAERVLDMLVMVLLAGAAVWAYPSLRLPVILLATTVIAALPVLGSAHLHRLLDTAAERLPGQLARGAAHRFVRLLHGSRTLLAARTLYSGMGLGIAAWTAEACGFAIVVRVLDGHLPVTTSAGIYALGIIAGVASFLPGGIGGAEAAMSALLVLNGVAAGPAIGATLVCRLATLWFAIAIGACALLALQVGSRARVVPGA